MDFVDLTLVRLADPDLRAALFDSVALEQLLSAVYDVSPLGLEGPFLPIFDEVQIGISAGGTVRIDGEWKSETGGQRTLASFEVSGLAGTAPRIDGLWRGAVRAQVSFAPTKIEEVDTQRANISGIDEAIVAALGSLPDDPIALEAERHARLLARIKAVLSNDDAFDDFALDRWLHQVGVKTAGELLARRQGNLGVEGMRIAFTPAPAVAPLPVPRVLPVTAAILIRAAGFSIAQLLDDTRRIEDRLTAAGLVQAGETSLRPRKRFAVIWLLPASTFDDVGWPGGASGMDNNQLRDARRRSAGQWLAREGIGLAVVP